MGKPPTPEKKAKKSRERMAKSTPEKKRSKKTAKSTPEKAPSKKTVKKSKVLGLGVGSERRGDSSSSAVNIADVDVHTGASSASFWLPMSRVWRLVRGEGVNANITAKTTADVIFLINKASEMFLEKLVEDAYFTAKKVRRKAIHYNDLALNVNNKKRYEFLSDFVPEKITAEDALKAQTTTKHDITKTQMSNKEK